jgi:hypothetical protein
MVYLLLIAAVHGSIRLGYNEDRVAGFGWWKKCGLRVVMKLATFLHPSSDT